jgi:queuosine biosynthesis protein QueD
MEISKTFKFEASHVLPNHPGKCSNLHGHSWVLTVSIKGDIDPNTGMVADYGDLAKAVNPIINDLDHAHLGAWSTDRVLITHRGSDTQTLPWGTKEVEWLFNMYNPTSENLLVEIAKQLVKTGCPFSSLTLNETCTTSCSLTWEEFNAIGR